MGINIVLIALVFWAVGCLVLGWLLDTWQERRIDTHSVPVIEPHYTRRTNRVHPKHW